MSSLSLIVTALLLSAVPLSVNAQLGYGYGYGYGNTGSSYGLRIGIGVGVAVGVALIIVLIGFLLRRRRARAFSKTYPTHANGVSGPVAQNQTQVEMQPTGYYPQQQQYEAPAYNAYRPDASGYTPHQPRIPPPNDSTGAPAPAYAPPSPNAPPQAHIQAGGSYYAPPPGPPPPLDPTNVRDK